MIIELPFVRKGSDVLIARHHKGMKPGSVIEPDDIVFNGEYNGCTLQTLGRLSDDPEKNKFIIRVRKEGCLDMKSSFTGKDNIVLMLKQKFDVYK